MDQDRNVLGLDVRGLKSAPHAGEHAFLGRRRECRARCILVSAFLNDDVRCQAKNLGVDRVLEKPVGIAELRRTLEELLPVGPGNTRGRVTVAS